jgi:lipopolysaccharide export system permease protein
MIFERSLQRELAYTAGAVFMVLLTIFLTTMMIRIVGFAASGEIDPKDVVVLIGLTVIGYIAVMLVVTIFVSILFVLTRWYRDSEMVVWLASGVSLTQFIKPIVCDAYDAHPTTGAFVLIDEATHHTVAAGMIRAYSA